MGKVAVVPCKTYEDAEKAVFSAVEQLGGIEKFIKPGEKVHIKPNLVMKRKPDDATTTHPDVVRAVANLVKSRSCNVTIGDTPGGICTESVLKSLYETCGMVTVAEKTGAKLVTDTSFTSHSFKEGKVCKAFDVVDFVGNADKVISVGKVKTHMLSYMTGCVKNLFGVIPGTYKAEYHFRMPDKPTFCDMLVDLCEFVHPVLSVCDAVMGMEGDGPTSGTPRYIGYIVAGENPHEVDYILSKLINLEPELIYTLENAKKRGLFKPSDIQVIGDFKPVTDFKKPSARDINFSIKNPFASFLNFFINPKPQVNKNKCVGCGRCSKVCPAKAITMVNNRPLVDYKNCIRCFCCHELCPIKAMEIKRPFIWKLAFKLSGKKHKK